MGAEPALGEVIAGYRLERLLGAGAMSRVYLGAHVRLNRRAAIKVLDAELALDPHTVRRLLDEARIVNDIHHPRIIDIFDFVEHDEPKRVALVMQYIEGPSLRAVLDARALSFAQAIGVILELLDAVQAAHDAGVVHRDLKPENLLFVAEPARAIPELKVVDFGIAKSVAFGGARTATGTMIGTPAYMAPEQIAGSPPPSPATDVYAIGELLYEVLSRKRMFEGEVSEILRAKMRGTNDPIDADVRVRSLIERCVAFEPEARPSIAELQRELRALATMPARSPAWVVAATAFAFLGIAATAVAMLSEPEPQPEPEPELIVRTATIAVPRFVPEEAKPTPKIKPKPPLAPIPQEKFPSW